MTDDIMVLMYLTNYYACNLLNYASSCIKMIFEQVLDCLVLYNFSTATHILHCGNCYKSSILIIGHKILLCQSMENHEKSWNSASVEVYKPWLLVWSNLPENHM